MHSQKGNINLDLILEGCRKGSLPSQRKLYEHFYGYGLNISLRYAKNRVEAEEILHDGFLKIFFNLDKYDKSYQFKSWLRKVIINAAIDYYRKFKKHRLEIASDQLSTYIEDNTPLPPIGPTEDVLPILQELPPAYRMVFNLYVMEGYKHHEIAEQLQISVGTSKSNLARAKAKLKVLWLAKKGINSKVKEHG